MRPASPSRRPLNGRPRRPHARAGVRPRVPLAVALLATACGVPEPAALPDGSMAFAVFGDGPYQWWEGWRFRRLLEDVAGADVEWLIHIGDILWYPCSDEAYAERLETLSSLDLPVLYTPGDNEWADCHQERPGRWEPLERLDRLRTNFFADPRRSIGGRPLPVESQVDDSAHSTFVENARWRRAGFVFATVHMVGSENAGAPFPGRTGAHDAEVARRTAAALAWLDETFASARDDSLHGVVIALHGNPFRDDGTGASPGYEEFVNTLDSLVGAFPGEVLLINGDTHTWRADHPLVHAATGAPHDNFTRLETFGSPDIGWVRVVMDTVDGRISDFQPRLMPGRLPFH